MEQVDSRQAEDEAFLGLLLKAGEAFLAESHGDIPAGVTKVIEEYDRLNVGEKHISEDQLPMMHDMLAVSVILAAKQKKAARAEGKAQAAK